MYIIHNFTLSNIRLSLYYNESKMKMEVQNLPFIILIILFIFLVKFLQYTDKEEQNMLYEKYLLGLDYTTTDIIKVVFFLVEYNTITIIN